jgi:hypothetical protein
MEQTFKKYLKQARQDFAKVVSKYTVTEHLELRTAIDSLLIAYGQATDKAINFTDSSLQLKHRQEIEFEKWIRDNNYEKITELNYKKGRKVININTLRRLYNIEYINL